MYNTYISPRACHQIYCRPHLRLPLRYLGFDNAVEALFNGSVRVA
jgi:hypothetical protein